MSIFDVLNEAIKLLASDIHISSNSKIKFRINGDLLNFNDYELNNNETQLLTKELIGEEYIVVLEKENEVDLSKTLIDNTRLRINAYKQKGSYSLSIRIINSKILSFEELGLKNVLESIYKKQSGLILITGVTGSGKSTTLSSIIDKINNTQKKHIITLEDPIEYIHKSNKSLINQREIKIDTKNYNTGLKSILRQDPDVILIGEMRDTDTIEASLKASETGHLVFSTLHTMGASKSIDRIIDSFESSRQNQIRMQLSTVLQAIICQKLVKTNYGKRVLVAEVMIVTPAIRNLIRENKTYQIQNIIQTSSKNNMKTLDQDLVRLYREKTISKETLIENCNDIEFVENMIRIERWA